MKIFGREPALWLATLQAVLTVLVGFQFDFLNAEQASLIVAGVNVIIGVITAWAVRPIAPVAFTAAFSTLAALGAAYGLDMSQEMVASINLAIVAVVTLAARGQISPAGNAWQTGVMGNKVVTEPNASARSYGG